MQVVDFTDLIQFAKTNCIKPVDFIKLHQVCEHQTYCNLIFADLLQVDETTCITPACSSQLAASLLTTWNIFVISKPEQAMRTHPDFGDRRLAATCALLAVYCNTVQKVMKKVHTFSIRCQNSYRIAN